MYSITITLTEPRQDQALLLVPKPPATGWQRLVDFATEGAAPVETVSAINSRQEAWVIKPESPTPPVIRYAFDDAQQSAPDWLWTRIDNRHTRASPALRRLVADLTRYCRSDAEKLQVLMGHAAERFDYDHPRPEERFNHGHDTVPALTCGTTPGSCIDINTYLLGALGCTSIQTAYMAGFYFAADVAELAACLQPLIDDLPENYRVALVLSETEGLPQQQAAERLGLSLSGAKSRIQWGREKLRRNLLECCDIETGRTGIVGYERRTPKCDGGCD